MKMILFVIVIALAIIASMPLLGFANVLFSMFTPDRDAEALNNLGALSSAVKTAIDSESHYIFIRTPLKLTGRYCIAAFDTDFVNGELTEALDEAYKPSQCLKKACLCLFKKPGWGSPSQMQESLLKCYSYDRDIVFYSDGELIAGTDKDLGIDIDHKRTYKNFVVFGWNFKGYKRFGSHDLWIEKRTINKKDYVYITLYDSEKIKQRTNNPK